MITISWKYSLPLFLAAAVSVAFAQSTPATAPAAPTQTAPAPAASVPASPATTTAAAPTVEEQASFTVVGVTVRTSRNAEAGDQAQIPGLWQSAMMSGQLQQVPNRQGDDMYVVYSDYSPENGGSYNYTLGVRVTSVDKAPDGMVVRVIPAGRYAVIKSEQGPPQEVIPAMWQRIDAMTPQQLGGERAYQTDFEDYAPITDFSSMQSVAHIGLK